MVSFDVQEGFPLARKLMKQFLNLGVVDQLVVNCCHENNDVVRIHFSNSLRRIYGVNVHVRVSFYVIFNTIPQAGEKAVEYARCTI